MWTCIWFVMALFDMSRYHKCYKSESEMGLCQVWQSLWFLSAPLYKNYVSQCSQIWVCSDVYSLLVYWDDSCSNDGLSCTAVGKMERQISRAFQVWPKLAQEKLHWQRCWNLDWFWIVAMTGPRPSAEVRCLQTTIHMCWRMSSFIQNISSLTVFDFS